MTVKLDVPESLGSSISSKSPFSNSRSLWDNFRGAKMLRGTFRSLVLNTCQG